MINIDNIISYIKYKYKATSIIVYGSYADGSNNENSDFDALVIVDDNTKFHDISFINDIQLDVFVYPKFILENGINYADFVQIFDGKIVYDTNGYGEKFKNKVLKYIDSLPIKSREELLSNVGWCEKMLLRAKREDVEGKYRWHWVLTESLEIFFDIKGVKYFGPKKALKIMMQEYKEAFDIYNNALCKFEYSSLEKWILYLKNQLCE